MVWAKWLKRLRERWQNWSGDHEMELAIRRHLSDQGFRGAAAELRAIKLIAIERPGWVQIYRFEAIVSRQLAPDDEAADASAVRATTVIYGLVRDDGRTGSEVETLVHPARRIELFHRWATGMIQLRGAFGGS